MGAVVGFNQAGVGSTNVGAGHFLYHRTRRDTGFGGHSTISDDFLDEEKISGFGEKYARKRSLEQYRSDTLSEISSGLNVLASGIKVITTIFSLFGAESVDRNDGFDDAVGTMMSLGATVLKFGVTKMLETSDISGSISNVNKIGEAAPTSQMTPEELAHQKKVQAFISKLSPEQVKLQQQLVQDHVNQQAQDQHLNSIQAAELLSETLQHNGLPPINAPVKSAISTVAGSLAGGESLVNSLFSSILGAAGGSGGTSQDPGSSIPGLPQPGTLEHTVTLALFNLQQSLNSMLRGKSDGASQPPIDNKLGVAADAVITESAGDAGGGILSTVASLPQSVGGAAFQLLKFITPPSAQTASTFNKPGVTYSEVTTGVDPTYTALGLLGTGALGSVLYSYIASDSDLASSATALAKGAVDAIKRNDFVDAAANAIASITGNKFEDQADPANLDYNYYDHENTEDYNGYTDYGYDYAEPSYTDQDYKNSFDYSYADPVSPTGFSDQDPYSGYPTHQTENKPTNGQNYAHNVPEKIQFYEPDIKVPDIPYEPYKEEHSPWELMNSGESTNHLYRAFQ